MHREGSADVFINNRPEELASLLAAGFLWLKRRTGCLPSDAFALGPLPSRSRL